jgi:glycosyltransferase involved in cell wall biosynthesis
LIAASLRVPGVELVIAGDGPDEAALRGQAGGVANIRFLGRVDAARLVEERAAAWAVALPSTWYENAPLALLEAYASGRAVLAAAHGGLLEMVDEDVTGWLVPPGDVDAWEGTLRRVEREHEGLARMGGAARTRAEERYRFEGFVSAYERAYRSVAGLSGP